MRWFFIYSFVAFIGLGTITILANLNSGNQSLIIFITLLSVLLHYFLLSFFFYGIFIKRLSKLSFLFVFFCSIPLIFISVIQDVSDLKSRESFSIVNFYLLISCILYYYQLFTSEPREKLLAHPSFWVVSGIFFSMGMTIPFYSVSKYLKVTLNVDVFYALNSIGSFAYGIMHLFFIKAYLCSLTTRAV